MIIKTPASVTAFCRRFQDCLTAWQRRIIPRMLISILMSFGNPNFSVLAGKVLSETRNRSSLSRFYSTIRFGPDKIYLKALKKFLASRPDQHKGNWFLLLDGTATRRGGFTKIGNAIKYREKKKKCKGGYPSTKAHMFLMGILLAPDGTRFPLPVLPYYTKEYCRQNQIEYKTQVELAAQMIQEAPVPIEAEKVIVLADEYYEGERVHNTCVAKGYSYIIPTDSSRCLANGQGHRTSVTLHGRGRHMSCDLFRKIVLTEGQEETAPYRRLSEPGRKTKRVYHAYTEDQNVAGLGKVRVTYSWKKKKRKGKRSGGETFKVLVSNDMALSSREMIEYYELRWQIELFFRELKSVLGIHRFRGNSFTAFARFVVMVLLAFLYLEWTRAVKIKNVKSRRVRAEIGRLRTSGLISCLQNDIDEENVEYILSFAGMEKQARCAATILRRILRVA